MTETLEPQTITIIPVAELEKINATDMALAQLKAKASELVVIGTPNKAAYEEVHNLVMVAVKVRTGAKKVAETLAAPFQSQADAIINEGKRIGTKAKEAEDMLRPLKLDYESEQERIKEEAVKAEAAKIASRINALNMMQATFDGNTYNVYGVLIDAIEVKALPDDEFADLLSSATTAYNNEQLRLAEIENAAKIERERVAAEQQAERDRQAVIAREQEAERLRLQQEQEAFYAQQRAFQAEQKRVADELAQKQAAFAREQAEAERVRREAEQEAERKAKEIDDANTAAFAKQQAEQEEAERKAQWDIDEAKRIADEEAAVKAKNKADKDRAKRLAPDKNKLQKFFVVTGNTPAADVKEDEAIALQIEFIGRLHELVKEFTDRLPNL